MLEALSHALRERIGSQRYATWFNGSVEISLVDGNVCFEAPSTFERDLLRKRFAEEIRASVGLILGEGTGVSYSVKKTPISDSLSTKPNPTISSRTSVEVKRELQENAALGIAKRTKKTHAAAAFDNWVLGDSNREATKLCHRIVSGEHTASPIMIWGTSGTGKTHLLRAIAQNARLRDRRRRVLSLTAEQFLVAFVEAIRGGGLPSFRQKHRGVGLLIIDNVQQLLGKQRTTEEFLQTFDALLAEGAQIVLSADRGPDQLRELGPELTSRLAAGIASEIQLPDTSHREQILRKEARRRDLNLSDETLQALARRLIGGAREAQGALNRMALLAETFDLPLDIQLADRVTSELNRQSTPPVKMEDIQRAVCGVFGVEPQALRSKKRTKAVTEPRMLAMWLSRKLTGNAWSEIGDYYGRRSHSTVISAHRRVESLLASPQPTQLSTAAAGDLGEAIRRVEAALRIA